MEVKKCSHLKDHLGIDREFLKNRKQERKESKFECLGKFNFFFSLSLQVEDEEEKKGS